MRRSRVLRTSLAGLGLVVSLAMLVGCSRGAPAETGTPAPPVSHAPGAVTVDIAFLNHAPVLAVLDQVNRVLAKYGDRIKVTRYDLETPAGAAFAAGKHMTGHTPLAIFINGSMEVTEGGQHIRFFSFPQGQGTGMVPEGGWSVAALDAALAHATGARR